MNRSEISPPLSGLQQSPVESIERLKYLLYPSYPGTGFGIGIKNVSEEALCSVLPHATWRMMDDGSINCYCYRCGIHYHASFRYVG